MYLNKPIFRKSIQSCSLDECDCCDVYYSSEDEITDTSTSLTTSSSSTDSLCSCDTNEQQFKHHSDHHLRQDFKNNQTELNWIDHFTDRYGRVNYIKFLDDELDASPSKNSRTVVQKKFKKRPNYINKLKDWANNVKAHPTKQTVESIFDNLNDVQSNKNTQRYIIRLFNLIKNAHSKSVDKLVNNEEYINESGILNVICLQMQSLNDTSKDRSNNSTDKTPNDVTKDPSKQLSNKLPSDSSNESFDFLKYAYFRPAENSVDTNLIDHKKMFNLKGMHITLASIIEKIVNEKLLKSKLALPRLSLLRTQELTKINLIYEQEEDSDLLVKFAIANGPLTSNHLLLTAKQFQNLINALVRIIKFQFGSLEEAFLNVTNQSELHNLFHIISFLLHNNQLNSVNYQDANRELSIDLCLCEQLTINNELIQYIQQVMIDFECLTWLNQFDRHVIDSTKQYSCLNSAIFYKGKLICTNIYQQSNQQNYHSDLKLYLKSTGLISLSKLAKTKFVKWMPIYLNSNNKNRNDNNESSNHLLIIIVEHILYAIIWKFSPLEQTSSNSFIKSSIRVPKRLINEGLHFIVRLVKKTSLIDEIDYELRLQSYWYSLPVSLDEFKEKRGHILQRSIGLWNTIQSNGSRSFSGTDQINVHNKPNQWKKALMNANIQRNLNESSNWLSNELKGQKNKSKFNIRSMGQSFSIYGSLRSSNSSTVDSLNSSNQSRSKSSLYDQNDTFTGELKYELDALSRTLKQIRNFMVDYLVCYLIEDHQNAIYQSPILSRTLVQRLGNSFIRKFKQKCAILDNQIDFLYPDVREIGVSFEARLPIVVNSGSVKSTTINKKTIILPLAKSTPNLQQESSNHSASEITFKKAEEDVNESPFKTIKFWLHLIKLDLNRNVYLCFIDNHLKQQSIDAFLYHHSHYSKFR